MYLRLKIFSFLLFAITISSCNGFGDSKSHNLYKGVYTAGPEIKSFKDCDSGQEFWTTDKSGELELKYSKLNVEKSDEPIYLEVEGQKIKTGKDGMGSELDSTLIINKVIKITRQIPQDMCN